MHDEGVRARSVVATMFDFSTTAPPTFGTYWRRLTSRQRDEASTDQTRQRLVFGSESVSGERATVGLTLTAGRYDLPTHRRLGATWLAWAS